MFNFVLDVLENDVNVDEMRAHAEATGFLEEL